MAGRRGACSLVMDISKTPIAVAPLHDISGIASGSIYRATVVGGSVSAELPAGKKAVLETAQGETLEVLTRDSISGKPTASGTFLNPVDLATFNDRSSATLRLYTWKDTWNKIRSQAGITLLMPALLALLTAGVGLYFLLASQTEPTSTTLSDTSQSLVAWVAQAPPSDTSTRSEEAGLCLQRLEGHQVAVAPIPEIACTPPTTPWWKSTVVGSIVIASIGAITALVGVVTLRSHYSFRKSPAK